MTEKPEDGWAAATREGSRRAQLRRALQLTPRQRLEAMLQLGETAQQLAAAPRRTGRKAASTAADGRIGEEAAGYGGRSPAGAHEVPLPGCGPIPLAGYLKALGILRLVAKQADPDARGYWENEQFILCSQLDAEGLRRFLLEEYRPTPVLAPWNGGSGFYPKDNKSGIGPLEQGAAPRFSTLRSTIQHMHEALAERGLEARPEGDAKTALLASLRAGLPDAALAWMDAAVVLTDDSPDYPPLLGTGGNDGRLDFTNNFLQRLVALFEPETGEPAAEAPDWLDEALFNEVQPSIPSAKVGQFAPGDAGGPNQVSGFDADKPLVNPWDFILMLEGALLFATAATKRLESSASSTLSYPFTVRTTGAGTGSTSTRDEKTARNEFWAPLWSAAMGLPELRALLAEGRVTLGRRPAQDGLDFVRAVSRLGVERGIDAFQRYAFLMRSGKAFFATPLNRITVRRNRAADLIDDLDTGNWLSRFRRHARTEGANRVLSLARRLEDALFELTTAHDDRAPVLRRLLTILGDIQLYLARSPKARENCPPVPSLSAQWFTQADDGSPEMALAAALAGLHARGRQGQWLLPMRAHLAPERPGRYPGWDEEAHHAVTWYAGSGVSENLAGTLHRRLLQAEAEELPDRPLQPARTAPLADVAAWLAGEVDEQRLAELLPGLMLVRIAGGGGRTVERSTPLPAAYRLLKPLFCTEEQLHRTGLLPPEATLPLPAGILRRLEAGDVAGALEQGVRRLRASGLRTGLHAPAPGTRQGQRLLAALMVPISNTALKSLLRLAADEDHSESTATH